MESSPGAATATPMDGTACQGGPGTDSQHVCGMCGILYDMSYPLGAAVGHAMKQDILLYKQQDILLY